MNIREWLTLDKLIEEEKMLETESENQFEKDIAKINGEFLRELKQRRESNLRPADKFLVNSIGEQFSHMESEIVEIEEEFLSCDMDIERTAYEVIDLQMSCETMLAILGLDEQQRMESRRKVIEKNRERGYYNG
jgi:hypothetical protein